MTASPMPIRPDRLRQAPRLARFSPERGDNQGDFRYPPKSSRYNYRHRARSTFAAGVPANPSCAARAHAADVHAKSAGGAGGTEPWVQRS